MKISELSSGIGKDTSLLVLVEDNETKKISKTDFLKSYSGTFAWDGGAVTNLQVTNLTVNDMVIMRNETPLNSGVSVKKGTIFFDDNYLYIAVADNVLKRVALEVF